MERKLSEILKELDELEEEYVRVNNEMEESEEKDDYLQYLIELVSRSEEDRLRAIEELSLIDMEELKIILQSIFQYGGTVIMAGLFIWVFVTDKTKNNKLEEENNQMLKLLTDNQKNIAESNNNIAKSLEIISNNLIVLEICFISVILAFMTSSCRVSFFAWTCTTPWSRRSMRN